MTSGTVTLTQTAVGGNGGSASGTASTAGGAGASPSSSLNFVSSQAGLTLAANATGGNGGSGNGTGLGGVGGNATASASGSATSGGVSKPISVTASATGGAGTANSLGGTAQATAESFAGTGSLIANATASGVTQITTAVSGQATAPVVGFVGESESIALLGQAAGSLSLGSNLQAGAMGIGTPVAGDVNTAWAGDSVVRADFANSAGVQGLAFLSTADALSTQSSALDYVSELTFTLNGAMLGSNDLLVGLLNPTMAGVGLQNADTITFQITDNGSVLRDELFTSNAAFLSYFQDNVLNLGAENMGLNGGNLNLEFSLDFSSAASGTGFSTDLVFGNQIVPTPEPSSLALLAMGAVGSFSRFALFSLSSADSGSLSRLTPRGGRVATRAAGSPQKGCRWPRQDQPAASNGGRKIADGPAAGRSSRCRPRPRLRLRRSAG